MAHPEELHALSPGSPSPRPARRWFLARWQDVVSWALLIAILATGFSLRAVGHNWDDFTHLHPDERFLTDVASRIRASGLFFGEAQALQQLRCQERYPAPDMTALQNLAQRERDALLGRSGVGGYFDADCSYLNPNNIGFGLYVYGQFPLFSIRVLAESMTEVERAQCLETAQNDNDELNCDFEARLSHWEQYNGIHFVGRAMSTMADTLSILLIFLIGAKLFTRWQALLGAALYAFAAFPIQQSHFWTVDAFTSLWVMLTIYTAVNVLDDDAQRPAQFSPLLWWVAAFTVWVVELTQSGTLLGALGRLPGPLGAAAADVPTLGAPTAWPLLVYGVALSLAAIPASWVRPARNPYLLTIGLALGIGVVVLALVLGVISPIGAVAAGLAVVLIALLNAAGLNQWAAPGGTLPWLMAAYCLWVFDALAHASRPSLTTLVIYLMVLAVAALLAGALFRASTRQERVFWLMVLALPVSIWLGLDVLAGAVSWEGALAALLLAGALTWAGAYGYRDYAAFGIAFAAALAGRVNVAPVVGVLLLAVLIRS
ncbi:MAG: hypothetical protein HC915_11695, partial [Anaerolineae bacterium]|nr:hypothetical protein [Anaerolineae bacterium]